MVAFRLYPLCFVLFYVSIARAHNVRTSLDASPVEKAFELRLDCFLSPVVRFIIP